MLGFFVFVFLWDDTPSKYEAQNIQENDNMQYTEQHRVRLGENAIRAFKPIL